MHPSPSTHKGIAGFMDPSPSTRKGVPGFTLAGRYAHSPNLARRAHTP